MEGVEMKGRPTGERTHVVEVSQARLPGLASGDHSCIAARRLQVLPGVLLGTDTSVVVVTHDGTEPRATTAAGRLRLTWLPGDVAA